jgi:hypothetical protein
MSEYHLKVRDDYYAPALAGREGEVVRRLKGSEIYIARIDGLTTGYGSSRDEWTLTSADFEWLEK